MHVSVTVPTSIELEAAITLLHRELGRVTALARDRPVQALEGKRGERMGAKPDLLG